VIGPVRRLTGVFAALLVGLGAAPSAAQQPGHFQGTVYDQTGGVLAAVTVTMRGPITRETKSDAAGRFEFRSLPAGDYDLSAVLKGFEPASREIRIHPGETVSLSVTLLVYVLEHTVVTAARTGATDVQTVPLAISAVGDTELTRIPIRTVEQAAAMVPAVTFTQNGTFGQLSIRGIGTNAVNAGADPSSAIYLDGVYLARPAMAFVSFLDVDRVEVLRGPQGTLYGRNAVGGALNMISKPPTNEFQASARVSTGNLGDLRADGRVSGALKRDRVLGSVAFSRGVRDGYVRDLNHPEHPLGGDDATAARGQLQVFFGRSDLLFSGDAHDQDGTLLTFNKVLQVKPGFAVDNPSDLHEVRTSTMASSRTQQSGVFARLTTAITSSISMVSLTAFRKLDNKFIVDADVTELHLLTTDLHERQHQWSQELTLSHRRPRLTWVTGVFLFDEVEHQRVWVDQYQSRTQVQLDPRVDATSAAVFGQTTVGVTRRLSVTGGLRYSRERKNIDNAGGLYTLDPPMTVVGDSDYDYTDSILHRAWTPKVGVELALPGNALAYGSATRGFKSGGFNLSSTEPGRGYAPEYAWSYEGGLKTPLMNGRARLNVAVYEMHYSNLQVQTPIGIGVFDIRNAAAATIRGVELETAARLGHGFDAGGHVAWLDATYDQYTAVAIGGITADVAGNRLNNAPEWSGRAWVEWTGGFGRSRQLTFTADATAQSTVYYTPFNDRIQRQSPFGVLGARVEYAPSHRRWSINAYARNLTDTDYIMATFATSPAAFGGRPAESRHIAIEFTVRR
jgi:iron complex outermembrane receptor protein